MAGNKPGAGEPLPKPQPPTPSLDRPLRIANGQAFWGDSILGPVRLVRDGPLDFLTLDYLAEVTMSVLHKLRARDPRAGYARDFILLLERILPACAEKGIRIIANAAGVNPDACFEAAAGVVRKHGLHGLKLGRVGGDDILPRLDELLAGGEPLANLDTGKPLATLPRGAITSANVYLGAEPIVLALSRGADVVITGRVADPALVIAPIVHAFGWSFDAPDLLAAAAVAGHVLECGLQATGGNLSDWSDVPDLAHAGFPIVEAHADGRMVITKHEGTGGRVDFMSVASQLVYEMGDPRHFLTPDVEVDLTSVRLSDEGTDRVGVRGAIGAPRPEKLKVSISYHDGYKAVGQLTVSGPQAAAKARLCARIVWERLAADGVSFAEDEKAVEVLGTGVCHEGIVDEPADLPEVVLRMAVRGSDRQKIDRFGREIAPLVTGGPPGVTGYAGGRPKATDVFAYWPALIGREQVRPEVHVETIR